MKPSEDWIAQSALGSCREKLPCQMQLQLQTSVTGAQEINWALCTPHSAEVTIAIVFALSAECRKKRNDWYCSRWNERLHA